MDGLRNFFVEPAAAAEKPSNGVAFEPGKIFYPLAKAAFAP